MEITLPLEKMSIEEKIQTMENIWDDLIKNAESIKSPSWHKEVILQREESIQNGTDKFVDWETAKKNIKDSLK